MRFNFRTMLLLVTVLMGGFGWAVFRLHVTVEKLRTVADEKLQRITMLQEMGALAFLEDGSLAVNSPSQDFRSLLGYRDIIRVANVNSDVALSLLPPLHGLKIIGISGPVTDSGVRHLRDITSLETLTIISDKLTDAGLEYLAPLTGLKTLKVSCTQVTDVGLQYLANLHQLEELVLSGTGITNEGLEQLRGLRNLRRLDISDTSATMGGLAHLRVDLQGRGFDDWFPGNVHREDGQVGIKLRNAQFQDDIVPYLLSGIPELTDLTLESTRFTNEGIAKLGKLNHLRELTLQYMGTQLTVVGGLPHVTRLTLVGQGSSPVPVMQGMPSLESLRVEVYPIDSGYSRYGKRIQNYPQDEIGYSSNQIDHIVKLVQESPKLDSLNFEGESIGDEHVAQLRQLKRLKHLNLARTQITGHSLKYISELSNLRSLQLWSTRVRDTGLRELIGLRQLRHLDLSATRITDAGIQNIGEMKSLRHLNLGSTKITDASILDLKEMKSLRHLDLDGTKITDASIQQLKEMKSLQELFMLETQLTKAGQQDLRNALPQCKIIFELSDYDSQ